MTTRLRLNKPGNKIDPPTIAEVENALKNTISKKAMAQDNML